MNVAWFADKDLIAAFVADHVLIVSQSEREGPGGQDWMRRKGI